MSKPPQKKDNALEIGRLLDKTVQVKLTGGREVVGVLKGFDVLLNLVLDETVEYLRDPDDPLRLTNETRKLGLVVARGTSVTVVAPTMGAEEIANPFVNSEGAE